MVRSIALLTLALASAGTVSCTRKATTSPAGVAAGPTTEHGSITGANAEAAHGSRRKALAGAPVFVDGALVASLRFGELPPGLAARSMKPGARPRHYRLTEYLSAIGVDVARVRAVHLRGNGHRVASIEAAELAAEPERFVFDFLGTETGAPAVGWDTTGLANKFRAHEIRDVLVYVDKAAPGVDAKRACYVEGDGNNPCSAKVPYADGELLKGTRVYLDGKLVGQVKRRRLGSELVVGRSDDGAHQFALAKLLASFGVDIASAKAVELVNDDDFVARAPAADVRRDDVTFTLPRHQSGRVLLAVPASWQAPEQVNGQVTGQATEARAAEVTAILVYQQKAPRQLTLSPIPSEPPPSDEPPRGTDG